MVLNVGTMFACIAPLTVFFVILWLLVAVPIWSYNLQYVWRPRAGFGFDSGGFFWPSVIRLQIFALQAAQVATARPSAAALSCMSIQQATCPLPPPYTHLAPHPVPSSPAKSAPPSPTPPSAPTSIPDPHFTHLDPIRPPRLPTPLRLSSPAWS
jgi:hypothetical protein